MLYSASLSGAMVVMGSFVKGRTVAEVGKRVAGLAAMALLAKGMQGPVQHKVPNEA